MEGFRDNKKRKQKCFSWRGVVKKEALNKRLASGGQGDCPQYGRAGTEGGGGEAATFSTIFQRLCSPVQIVEVTLRGFGSVLPSMCPLCLL